MCGVYTTLEGRVPQRITEEQMCRVIQCVIEKATSVKEMREAILSCRDPQAEHCMLGRRHSGCSVYSWGAARDIARNFLSGGHETVGCIASCSACGGVKKEEDLQNCACMSAYYCDQSCQKDHWPQHKPGCTAVRKAKKKKQKA